jgi:hypothetical protein
MESAGAAALLQLLNKRWAHRTPLGNLRPARFVRDQDANHALE